MMSGTTLTIRPSLVVSLSTTTANDDGSGEHICISYPCGTITAQKQALCILMSLSLACMVEQRVISLAG